MSKGNPKRKRIRRPSSFYTLSDVIQKIDSGQYVIRSNAADFAFKDFGWETPEIIKAIKLLREKHFCESIPSKRNAWRVFDVYKARILGEHIYTHLYIDDTKGILVINSFKEDKPLY